MKKQTAVEWLIANIDWQLLKNTSLHYEMIVNKAKEMEREQIEESFNEGYTQCSVKDLKPRSRKRYKDAEQYYTETFEP
jgi:predicted secreted protein